MYMANDLPPLADHRRMNMKTGTNRNPSATKKGPGRFHKQGHKKTKKSLTKAQ